MRRIILAMWLFIAAHNVMADNVQTVTVNGEPLQGKTVSKMTFNGSDVTLHFTDNTSDIYDIELVRVTFSTTSGINNVSVASKYGIVDGDLIVDGIPAGTMVNVFDMSGNPVASGKSAGGTVKISIDGLQGGVYIMSAAGIVIKFMKK